MCVSVCLHVCMWGASRFILLIQGQFPIMQSEHMESCWNICIKLLHIYDTLLHMHLLTTHKQFVILNS